MFYRIAHLIVGVIYHILYRFRVTGLENVPDGNALICANHSSLSDPVLVALALKVKDRPRFMAKAELFKVFGLGRLIRWLGAYPVERGESDMAAVRTTLSVLKDGRKVLIFPQGHRFVTGGEDAPIKPGAAMLAFHSGAPIMPVYVSPGRKVFINRIRVVFGTPFIAEKQAGVKNSEQHAALSERLRREIYALKP